MVSKPPEAAHDAGFTMSDENTTIDETATEPQAAASAATEHAEHAGVVAHEPEAAAPVLDEVAAVEDEPVPEAAAEEQPEEATVAEADAAVVPDVAASKMHWYVVKVQSGREETIKAAVERKVKIEGLEEFFGQIAVPVERTTEVRKVKVTDKKTGEKVTQEKRVVKERKKYQGYIFAEVEFNDRILYLFRETSGVGDFVGATMHRAPNPMTDREVQSMLTGVHEKGPKGKGGQGGAPVKVKLDFEKGDKVRIRDGAFTNMEGEVKLITEPKDASEHHKVTVVVTVFGRPVDVVVDHWHVDKV